MSDSEETQAPSPTPQTPSQRIDALESTIEDLKERVVELERSNGSNEARTAFLELADKLAEDRAKGPSEPAFENADVAAEVIREMNYRLAEAEATLDAIGVNEIDGNTPDDRALRIRKWLYEQANDSDDGKASMDKMVAKGVLGNLHREQRYEAMRRAADGNKGARSGSSSLSPVQGIEFEKFDDPDRLTRVRIDLGAMTQGSARQILTTDDTNGGV